MPWAKPLGQAKWDNGTMGWTMGPWAHGPVGPYNNSNNNSNNSNNNSNNSNNSNNEGPLRTP